MEQTSRVHLALKQSLLYAHSKSSVLQRQLRTHKWKDCREGHQRHEPSSRLPNDTLTFVNVCLLMCNIKSFIYTELCL